MIILSLKSKKDAHALLEKAHKAEEHVTALVECLEETIEEMEDKYGDYEEGYKHDDYDDYNKIMNRKRGRYDYMRKMR